MDYLKQEVSRRIREAGWRGGSGLDLGGLSLTTVPESVRQLTNLSALDLGANRLDSVPEWIGQFSRLRQLQLHNNGLTTLPDSLGQLGNLTSLRLTGNLLSVLPEWIGQLTNLTHLDLEATWLTALPEWIGRLTHLTELVLRDNGLAALPDSIGQLAGLTHLDLSGNQLTALPDSLGHLSELARLDLEGNRLTALPDSLGQLGKLVYLDLSGNRLTTVPDSLGQLSNLMDLKLRGNRLTSLPNSLGRLSRLSRLNLSDNRLTAVPQWPAGQPARLTTLDLDFNRLTTVPESIGQFADLSELTLDNNQLSALPESIGRLARLDTFTYGGNPLSSPPREVQAQGSGAVLAFLRAVAVSPVERWNSKLLVVGEATVGKTSLVKQLFDEEFNPQEGQTHGLRVRTLSLRHPDRPDVQMTLDAWDFGGQLEYRATQRFYLTSRSLFLLVWNSRARSDDGKVIAWLDAINARAPDAPVVVVATHGDEESPATLPHDLRERYPSIVAVHVVDSRTRLGIDSLREVISSRAKTLPLMGARWPASWAAGAQALDRASPELTVTTHRAFQRMVGAGVPEADVEAVARIQHDLGRIAYFGDIPDLATRIILKPEWLDARITQVIDSPAVTAAGGVLSRSERQRLWGDLAAAEDDPDLPARLIRMMEAFDLAYRVGDSDESEDVALIVDRLPDAPSAEVDEAWRKARSAPGAREITVIYKLASRQAGIPTWFIAREHRYTTGLHWRHGVLLHDRDTDNPAWALLTDDGREQPSITLRVTGAFPVRFYSVLAEAFDGIIRARYPGLIEQHLVPCLCRAAGSGGACPHTFTLKELQVEATAGDGDGLIRCPESRQRIEAALMLDGLRGTGLTEHLGAIERTLESQAGTLSKVSSTLNAVDARQQAMLNGIRTLLEDRAGTGTRCPGLFSVYQSDRTRWLHRVQIIVTLWCEWPSGPHPLGSEGRYPVTKMPEALVRYLPYLHGMITMLGLASPLLGAAGLTLSDQAKDRIEAASRTLEFIEKRIEAADSVIDRATTPSPEPSPEPSPFQTETGADFRALAGMLRALDPGNKKNWGGLSPVNRPEDQRIIFLCSTHLHELNYPYTAAA